MTGVFDGLPFTDACVEGLAAIADKRARAKICPPLKKSPENKVFSVDIDSRMRKDYPTANRWDYGVIHGYSRKRIEFIEVHPAESGEVEIVIKKQKWLMELITGYSLPPHSWHWIPSGKITILPHSRYSRSLALAKINLVSRKLQL